MHGFYRGGFALLQNDKSQTSNLPYLVPPLRNIGPNSYLKGSVATDLTPHTSFGTDIAFTTAKTKQRCKNVSI